jgi:hypothetical protein
MSELLIAAPIIIMGAAAAIFFEMKMSLGVAVIIGAYFSLVGAVAVAAAGHFFG